MFNIWIKSKTVSLYTDTIVNPCLYLFTPVHSRQQTAHILINVSRQFVKLTCVWSSVVVPTLTRLFNQAIIQIFK